MTLHRSDPSKKGVTLCGVRTTSRSYRANAKRGIESDTASAHAVNCGKCLSKMLPGRRPY